MTGLLGRETSPTQVLYIYSICNNRKIWHTQTPWLGIQQTIPLRGLYYSGRQSQQSFLLSPSTHSLHVSARADHLQVNIFSEACYCLLTDPLFGLSLHILSLIINIRICLVTFCKFTSNDLRMVIYKMLSYPINNKNENKTIPLFEYAKTFRKLNRRATAIVPFLPRLKKFTGSRLRTQFRNMCTGKVSLITPLLCKHWHTASQERLDKTSFCCLRFGTAGNIIVSEV
jgi:hypothetical protein